MFFTFLLSDNQSKICVWRRGAGMFNSLLVAFSSLSQKVIASTSMCLSITQLYSVLFYNILLELKQELLKIQGYFGLF